ncbi:putative cytochrome b5, partial [Lachnellula occidentalis]
MLKEYTVQDILPHNTKKSLFVVIHDKVYDATDFVDDHPGGRQLLFDQGGNDATEPFDEVEHSSQAMEVLESIHIGSLKRRAGDSALWPLIN